MIKLRILTYVFVVAGLMSCSSVAKDNQTESSVTPEATDDTVTEEVVPKTIEEVTVDEAPHVAEVDHSANEDLINTVYNTFVFGSSKKSPKPYFTDKALRKLKAAYDYDCEGGNCYAYWELRTDAQDGPNDVSRITSIEPGDDGWYVVSYKDMGISGKTRIKIVNGKIDEYKRLK